MGAVEAVAATVAVGAVLAVGATGAAGAMGTAGAMGGGVAASSMRVSKMDARTPASHETGPSASSPTCSPLFSVSDVRMTLENLVMSWDWGGDLGWGWDWEPPAT